MNIKLLHLALPLTGFAMPAHAVVGMTSTGAISKGGDTKYLAQGNEFSGVVGLMIDWGNDSYMTCSGFLLSDRRSVVTAGHCTAEDGGKTTPVSTTVYFDNGSSPDADIFSDTIAGNVQIEVSNTTTHPDYTTSAVDQNDIAVLTLSELAPDWATGYEIYEQDDLAGQTFTSVGYGLRGIADAPNGLEDAEEVGSRRQGTNTYDYRMGDDAFNDHYTRGDAKKEYLYVTDFDDGSERNDTNCRSASHWGDDETGKYCDQGSSTEVANVSGDSGGPQFIDGKVASLSSSGVGGVNGHGTAGATNNLVPLYIHTNFIRSAMIGAIPEPATWLQLLLGFAMLGGMLRARRRDAAAVVA